MRAAEEIQREINIAQADLGLAHAILQLQTDDSFLKLQKLFRDRANQITEAICTKSFEDKIQHLGKLQGERQAILEFCKAPGSMQKEILALSNKVKRLQNELNASVQKQSFQYQR